MGAVEHPDRRIAGGIRMNQEQMFKGAKWIECPGSDSPVFFRKFTASGGEKAEIVICGLGYFKLYINGRKVSDDLLVPNASNYNFRDLTKFEYPLKDELGFRIYCMKYDISDYITDGENTLAVIVGNGYYNQNARDVEGEIVYGTPKLCYIIGKGSGNVLSDSSTLAYKGFVTFNNLYFGEKQDYTLLPRGNDFAPSAEIPAPESEFFIQESPADKVIRSIQPVLLSEENGVKLYDAGENTAGYAVFKCAEKGRKIKVNYAEVLTGKRNYGMHFEEGYQQDEFITDGTDREYIPHFTWHGFRYFKVEGAEPLRVDVVHSDCPVTSSFECDNSVLNWLYEAYIRTQLANMHSGVPSDCPHRERLGYTGDGQLCCEAGMMLLDSKGFYRKWLEDIADCQCRRNGHVQHTAPLMGGGGGPCGWGGAIVEVPYKYYKAFGDKTVLEEFFPKILKYFDYLDERSENGLVWREEVGGWCLGDWLPPEPIKIPEAFVNSCLYVRFMEQAIEIAGIIGKEKEAAHLAEKIEKVKQAIKVAYYSFQQGAFIGDIQGSSCLAARIGLADERVKRNIINKYKSLGQFDTGIICTEALIGWLFEQGEAQVAFDLLSNEKAASFAYMRDHGATTLWENWDGADSHDHPMFGAVTKYLFLYLLGIRQPDDSAAYEKVKISPCFVRGMNRAKGHITTPKGEISVDYVIENGKAKIKVFADESIESVFEYGDIKEKFSGKASFTVEVNYGND